MTKKKKLLLLLVLIIIFILWMIWDNKRLVLSKYKITSNNLPEDFKGYKIIQISDYHNDNYSQQVKVIITKEKPDIITITGDLIDSYHTNEEKSLNLIRQIKDLAPIYYVTGNHESRLSITEEFIKDLEKLGVNVLRDRKINLQKGHASINLIGIEDPDFSLDKSLDYEVKAMMEDKLSKLVEKDKFNLLLSHRPEHFESYVDQGVDLSLTGHAHGGQFRLPFVGGLIAPAQGFFPKYDKGHFEKDGKHMVANSGLGNSILPVRFNNPREIVLIELE